VAPSGCSTAETTGSTWSAAASASASACHWQRTQASTASRTRRRTQSEASKCLVLLVVLVEVVLVVKFSSTGTLASASGISIANTEPLAGLCSGPSSCQWCSQSTTSSNLKGITKSTVAISPGPGPLPASVGGAGSIVAGTTDSTRRHCQWQPCAAADRDFQVAARPPFSQCQWNSLPVADTGGVSGCPSSFY
jgi:hypothetical protein